MKNIDNLNSILINILFIIFPFSLILGNLSINLNIVLLCICVFIFYYKSLIKFKYNFFDKIILIFFFYTLITLIVNFLESYFIEEIFPEQIISKTLFYFRYLALYLVVRFLITKNIVNLSWFSFTCAACATFVCFDIFYQFIFGKNIFGIEPPGIRHFSGVFGEEVVAGGYLQKFSLFTLFLPFVLNKHLFHKNLIQISLFVVFTFGIMLSGNRMPLVLFVFSFFIFAFLNKELRKKIFTIFIIVFLFLSLNFSFNQTFKINMINFYVHGKNLVNTFFIKDLTNAPIEVWKLPYVRPFYCGKHIWKKNPFFGGGIKSFRTAEVGCGSHPHNYYLEILSDLGLIGLSIILILFFMLLYRIFKNKITIFPFNLYALDSRIMPFFIIFFIEFFPVRSTGSFFTTNNSSVIFIVLAILVSLISKKKLYNY